MMLWLSGISRVAAFRAKLAFLVLPVKYSISKVVYFAFIRNVAPLVVSRASLMLCK